VKNLLLFDSGDLLFRDRNLRGRNDTSYELQGKMIIESMNEMGWTVLTPGETDFALGVDYLKELEAMADFPFVSANIFDEKTNKYVFEPYVIKDFGGFSVGITAVMGDQAKFSTEEEEELGIYLYDEVSSLKKVMKVLRRKSDFIVVLSHTGLELARTLAKRIDGIDLIVVGHRPEMNLYRPVDEDGTLITQTHSRGKYICRLDFLIENPVRPYDFFIEGTGDSSSLEYKQQELRLKQLTIMYEDYIAQKEDGKDVDEALDLVQSEIELVKKKLKELKERSKEEGHKNIVRANLIPLGSDLADDPKVRKIEDKYKDELIEEKNEIKESMLKEGERNPRDLMVEPHFVGVSSCKECHKSIYSFWTKTRHSSAYETLRKEKRQFEPNCYECHTTGFRKPGGFTNILTAKDLIDVQCEVCHGAGNLHVKNEIKTESLTSEKECITCHDVENDDDFDYVRDLKAIRCPEE